MRWTALFADLEAQFVAADQASLALEVRDRTRREAGLIRLVDRLSPALGQRLTVTVQGVGPIEGNLSGAGTDWILLTGGHGPTEREVLICSAAVLGLIGLGPAARPPASESAVSARLDLRWALRCLVRDRAGVQISLTDGALLQGTLDRVGADYVELAEHPQGEPRRSTAVRQLRLIPVTALALLRSS